MKKKSLSLLAIIALGTAIAVNHSHAASAGSDAPVAESFQKMPLAQSCRVPIRFPQGKEELSRSDIRLSVQQHFIRMGVSTPKILVTDTQDDTAAVQMKKTGGKTVFIFSVDKTSGEIIDSRPSWAGVNWKSEPRLGAQIAYNERLRRHVLGDGKPWGNWVGAFNASLLCASDYDNGGPDIPESVVQNGVR